MNIHHAIAIDTMELNSFMDNQRRTFKFRCCKFVKSREVYRDIYACPKPRIIKAKYSGRAVFTIN